MSYYYVITPLDNVKDKTNIDIYVSQSNNNFIFFLIRRAILNFKPHRQPHCIYI